jgi:hypothetical protein
MDPARVEQDPLGRSGLTGIDVSHDADIPEEREWCDPGHRLKNSLLFSLLSPGCAANKKRER